MQKLNRELLGNGLAHVTVEDERGRYDLGAVVYSDLKVYPHRRNRVINNLDAEARMKWLQELADEQN